MSDDEMRDAIANAVDRVTKGRLALYADPWRTLPNRVVLRAVDGTQTVGWIAGRYARPAR